MTKQQLALLSGIFAVVTPVIASGFWVYNYHTGLATSSELNQLNLDSRISSEETKVLIYTLIGEDKLDAVSKGRFKRANARLIKLEAKRDDILNVSSN